MRILKGRYGLTVPEVQQLIENLKDGKFEKTAFTTYVPLYQKKIVLIDKPTMQRLIKDNRGASKRKLAKIMDVAPSTFDKYLSKYYGSKNLIAILRRI